MNVNGSKEKQAVLSAFFKGVFMLFDVQRRREKKKKSELNKKDKRTKKRKEKEVGDKD